MAVDLKRVAEVAVNAAFNEDGQPPPPDHRGGHRSAARSLAAGVALAAVARVAVKKAPSLVQKAPDILHLPDIGELTDQLRDRVDQWFGEDEEFDEAEEPDEDEDQDDYDEEE